MQVTGDHRSSTTNGPKDVAEAVSKPPFFFFPAQKTNGDEVELILGTGFF